MRATSLDERLDAKAAEASPTAARFMSLTSVALYFALLVAFSLPFVSVSCTEGDSTAKTEVLTGWELLGNDVSVSGRGTQAASNVNDSVASLQRAGWLAITLVVGALAMAIATSVLPARPGLTRAAFASSVLCFLAMVVLLTAGSDFPFGPNVHHQYGFWIAFGLAAGGAVVNVFRERPEGVRAFARRAFLALFLGLPLSFVALMVGIGI